MQSLVWELHLTGATRKCGELIVMSTLELLLVLPYLGNILFTAHVVAPLLFVIGVLCIVAFVLDCTCYICVF